MRRTSSGFVGLTTLAASLFAASCSDSTGSPGNTRLTVKLTDAPGDVKAAVVTISQVYLQRGDGDSLSTRLVISDSARTVDLVTLVGTTTDLIAKAQVPKGSYTQLRFVITGGYLAVENAAGGLDYFATSPGVLPAGSVMNGSLQMPSYASSGLKVTLPDTALRFTDSTTTLTVDFDVAQSFGKAVGQTGRWVMAPVLQLKN